MSLSFPPPPPPPPPPPAMYQQSYGGKGSIGAAIGVLAVILVLAVAAAIVGRLCSGRSVFGYGQFDFEGWIERKCASCIDGRVGSAPPPPPPPPPEVAPPAANEGGGIRIVQERPSPEELRTPSRFSVK